MIKHLFILLITILIAGFFLKSTASNNAKLDSLQQEFNLAKYDSIKGDLMERIGMLHSNNTNYLKSIESLLESSNYFAKIGDKAREGETYNSIGAQYYYLENWGKAIEYWNKALDIAKELENIQDQGRYMNNIGLIYQKRGDYDKALEYQTNALLIRQQLNDTLGTSNSYNNLAQIYQSQGDNEKAIEYFTKSLEIKRRYNKKLTLVLQNLGYSYYKADKYKPALKYVNEALIEAKENDDIYNEISALWKLGDIYDAMKDFKNANGYIKLASQLEDTVNQINSRELIAEMDAKYEAEKKDNEIALQQVEIAKQNTEVKLQATQKIWFAIGLVLSLVLLFVAYRGIKQKQKANLLLLEKNSIIEEKNKDITDSITYASNIQQSILPDEASIANVLPNHFIFFRPKDIVSGDFYWFHEKDDLAFIIAADCTGHGVPGAFVSMLCNNVLNQVIIEKDVNDPGEILTQVNKSITESLRNKKSNFTSSDGMDCSLCSINKKTKEVLFAGAYNQLVIINNGNIEEVKADRTPIGGRTSSDYKFSTQVIEKKEGSCFYLFSDGFADQFGGPKGKKFMLKRLKDLFAEIHQLDFDAQSKQLADTLKEWKGDLEQVDDILICGFKI